MLTMGFHCPLHGGLAEASGVASIKFRLQACPLLLPQANHTQKSDAYSKLVNRIWGSVVGASTPVAVAADASTESKAAPTDSSAVAPEAASVSKSWWPWSTKKAD